jgi:PAS domain S-box-containing protein
MKRTFAHHLTIAVCENFFQEASLICQEQGWEDINLVSFPARCGRPMLSQKEIAILTPDISSTIVIGGLCVSYLNNTSDFSVVSETNCFSYICGASQLAQLLRQGAYLVSSGWLKDWRTHVDSLGFTPPQYQEFVAESIRKIVFLDTLTDDQGKANFDKYLRYAGSKGEHIEVGCEFFGLHLCLAVSEWRQKIQSDKLVQAKSESSQATLLLSLLGGIEPAISLQMAEEQVVDLFRMFMAPQEVDVEIVSSGLKEFRFSKDVKPISFDEFSAEGIWCGEAINGFYFLVKVDGAESAIIRVSGLFLAEKVNDYVMLAVSLKGLIRLLLYNGMLYDGLHAEIIHKEQIEKHLEKSENHFRFLYENAPLPYHSLDENGRIIAVNNAWLKALGYNKNKVVGQLFESFLCDKDVQKYRDFHKSFVIDKEAKSLELEVVKNDFTEIRIQVDASISIDNTGVVQQIHCIFVDISEQTRIQDLILQSEKLSTIAGLAAGIAHEINTPLSGIMQSAQLIEMFLDPENEQSVRVAGEFGVDLSKVREYTQEQELDYFIGGIRNSAMTASEIIQNLLEFSRPRKGGWASVRLSHLLDRIVQLILSDYDLKKKYNVINVNFEKEYDSKLPFIHCVSAEIEQVFYNVIKNAVHAMGKARTEQPKVLIRTRLKNNTAYIEIEDNGPGIKIETIKHIFDPFFTTKEPGEGTGLGLSVSYAIVTGKHSGLIWIDPEYKKGTKFVIELPAEARRSRFVEHV